MTEIMDIRTFYDRLPIFLAVIIIIVTFIITLISSQFENLIMGIISGAIICLVGGIYNQQTSIKEDKKLIEKYMEINEEVTNITPDLFKIADYSDYYHKRSEDDELLKDLNANNNVLIIGKPNAGKTRASYEAIKQLDKFRVIKFRPNLIEIERIPDHIFNGKIIIFFDDLNKYISKLDLHQLIKKLKLNSNEFVILITCRSGDEYENAYMEFEEDINGFKKINIKDIDKSTAKDLSEKYDLKFEEFDGATIGSLILGLSRMKRRYDGLSDECHVLFRVIKLLSKANTFTINKKTLEEIYLKKIRREMSPSHSFETVIKKLRRNSFILEEQWLISVFDDSYLDFSGYEVHPDDLIWLKGILIKTQDESCLLNLGYAFITNKNFSEAISCYDGVLKMNPVNMAAIINKGNVLSILGKDEEAIELFDKILEKNPLNTMVINNKGVSLVKLGRGDEVIELFNNALELNQDDFLLINQGNLLCSLGKYDEGIDSFNKAIDLNPRNGSAFNNKGNALGLLGKYDEAIKCFNKALDINPNDYNAWHGRGEALIQVGEHLEALNNFNEVININPNEGSAWYKKGISLAQLGRYNEAIKSLKRAQELSPRDVIRIEFEINSIQRKL